MIIKFRYIFKIVFIININYLNSMGNKNCPFCTIKETNKNSILYEDELILIFKDKSPVANVHLQCIPKVHIKNNKQFAREGDHLYFEQQISFPQATLGDLISIPTIEGKEVEFKIPAGTQSGTVFKLRGQGMTSYRHSGRGNMYVTVTVVVPKKLNSKQKKLLREFAEVSGDEIKHVEKGLFDRVKDAMK